MKLIALLFLIAASCFADLYQVTANFTQPPQSCQNSGCGSPVSVSFTYRASSIVIGVPNMLVIQPTKLTVTWNATCITFACGTSTLYSYFSLSAVGVSGIANMIFYYTLYGVSQSIQATVTGGNYTSPGLYTGSGGTITVTDLGP